MKYDAIKDHGGAAFPLHSEIRPSMDKEWCGMSLRDYFAAKAMQSLIHTEQGVADTKIAAWAYAQADAMLKAREA